MKPTGCALDPHGCQAPECVWPDCSGPLPGGDFWASVRRYFPGRPPRTLVRYDDGLVLTIGWEPSVYQFFGLTPGDLLHDMARIMRRPRFRPGYLLGREAAHGDPLAAL